MLYVPPIDTHELKGGIWVGEGVCRTERNKGGNGRTVIA